MKQYHDLLEHILANGVQRGDRTGTGTRSVFGYQMRFDLAEGFPLLTTKKVHFTSVAEELFWFLRGETNVRSLQAAGVTIWDEWADENGDLGPVYGKQWRSWPDYHDGGTIDQIASVLGMLRTHPDSRRLIVSAWNPADVCDMALPPCHCLFQFYTAPMSLGEREDWMFLNRGGQLYGAVRGAAARHHALDGLGVPRRKLSCQLYQRSADVFLGVPFNIASYALLTTMVAYVAEMAVGEFVWTGGDVHLYDNHVEQARLQLSREPRPLPRLVIDPGWSGGYPDALEDFRLGDFRLEGYDPHPAIKAPVAV